MRFLLFLPVLFFLASTAPWHPLNTDTALAASNEKIGVVLLHGQRKTDKWIDTLIQEFESSGVQLATPEMAWSDTRGYDVPFDVSMSEIHTAVQALKKKGVIKIFVGGHMMGGSAAAAYGAEHHDIAGIFLISPAHILTMEGFSGQHAKNVSFAKQKIGEGLGDQVFDFPGYACRDLTGGKVKRLRRISQMDWTYSTTPLIYLSQYHSGPIDMLPGNVKKLAPNTALLWVVDQKGMWAQKDKGRIFASAPKNSRSKIMVIPSNHVDIPHDAKQEIVEWVLATGTAE